MRIRTFIFRFDIETLFKRSLNDNNKKDLCDRITNTANMYSKRRRCFLNFAITPLPHDFKDEIGQNFVISSNCWQNWRRIATTISSTECTLAKYCKFAQKLSLFAHLYYSRTIRCIPAIAFSYSASTCKILSGYIHICTRIFILENKSKQLRSTKE